MPTKVVNTTAVVMAHSINAKDKRGGYGARDTGANPDFGLISPLLIPENDTAETSRLSSPTSIGTIVPSYGTTHVSESSNTRVTSSPERMRRENSALLDRVPEDGTVDFDAEQRLDGEDDTSDDEWEDEVLNRQGLYRGSYKRLIWMYTFVPLSSLAFLFLFTFIPMTIITTTRPSQYPYAPFLPFPLPELLTPAFAWSACYLLTSPIYSFCALAFSNSSSLPSVVSSCIYAIISLFFRLCITQILLLPHHMDYSYFTWHDSAFLRVWWIAIGWAITEAVVTIKQGYDNLALYRDVLVPNLADPKPGPDSSLSRSVIDTVDLEQSLQVQIERDLDELIALKAREELEELYGMPVIRIPVFLLCLQRLNAVLLALGFTLVISSSLTHEQELSLLPLFLLFIVQVLLSTLHSSFILPQLGVHTVIYIRLLTGLGTFFAGLGVWGALS